MKSARLLHDSGAFECTKNVFYILLHMATPAVLPQCHLGRLQGQQAPLSPPSVTRGVIGSTTITPFEGPALSYMIHCVFP